MAASRSRARDGSPSQPRRPPVVPPPDLVGEDLLSVTEAHELTGVPRSTIALWVRAGRFPRATVLQLPGVRAAWYIPITDLIAAGLVNRRRTKDAPLPRVGRLELERSKKETARLASEVERLTEELERVTLLNREQQAIINDLRRRLSRATGTSRQRRGE